MNAAQIRQLIDEHAVDTSSDHLLMGARLLGEIAFQLAEVNYWLEKMTGERAPEIAKLRKSLKEIVAAGQGIVSAVDWRNTKKCDIYPDKGITDAIAAWIEATRGRQPWE